MLQRYFKTVGIALTAVLSFAVVTGCSNHSATGADADVMFAQMMIPHHEQAVEMSTLAEIRASDPFITEIAQEIKSAQDPEIELMATWLEDWGFPQQSAEEAMAAHGGHGMSGMLTQEQLDELASLTGPAFDQKFAEYMILHHQGAIEMARGVEKSTNVDVASLAQSIIQTQQTEIDEMNAFLSQD